MACIHYSCPFYCPPRKVVSLIALKRNIAHVTHDTGHLACPSLILRVRGFVKRVSDSNDDACLLASTTKNIASNKTVIDV